MTPLQRIRAMLAGGSTAEAVNFGGPQILVQGGGRKEYLDQRAVDKLYGKVGSHYDLYTANDMIRCELSRAMIPLVKQEKRR